MIESIYLIMLIVLIILNIFVAFKLLTDDYYDKKQKIIQFLIVWLIPIIGVFIVYSFLKRNDKIEKNSYYNEGLGVEGEYYRENSSFNFESSSDSGSSGGGD